MRDGMERYAAALALAVRGSGVLHEQVQLCHRLRLRYKEQTFPGSAVFVEHGRAYKVVRSEQRRADAGDPQ